MLVKIYTDGAARGNPDGPGGYGTVLEYVDTKGQLQVMVKAKENVEKTRLYATIDTVNYSTTSYRASCFTHHRLMISEDIAKSYTVSTSVRFGLFHPYHNSVYRRFMLLPSVCADLLF